jgi:hypothetical protein
MRHVARLAVLAGLLVTTSAAMAEDTPPDNSTGDAPAFNDTHPVYSDDTHWTSELIVAIAGLLLAAAVVGPIVRAESPQAVPSAISHEEDPAADRH